MNRSMCPEGSGQKEEGGPEDAYAFFREVQENEAQGTTMLLNKWQITLNFYERHYDKVMKKEKRFQKCVPWKYGKDLDIAIFITSGRLANNEIRGRKGKKN